jgi:Flp pilus assembly protein TadD
MLNISGRTKPRILTALAALVGLVMLALPDVASAAWYRAESPRFIVYGSDQRHVREHATKLETFDDILRAFHGMPAGGAPARKFEVFLASGTSQLRRVRPTSAETTGGVYFAGADRVFVVVRRDFDDLALFHEYTHHFMYQHFPYGYPSWVVEGYAEYFGSTRIAGGFIDVGVPDVSRAATLAFMRQIPITDLLTKRPADLRGEQVFAFYAQAWLLTHYLMSDPVRKKQLDAYLLAVGAGADPVKAMTEATGLDLETLSKRLKDYKKIAYTRVTRKLANVHIAVSQLTPAADDLLLESIRPLETIPEAEQAAFLEKIRALAARHPSDRFAQLTQARTEIRFGDRETADAILKTLLSADANDVEALELTGISLMEAGDDAPDGTRQQALYRQARPYLIKAGQKDPNRYQALFAYARSRRVEDAFPNENDLNALIAARQLAPQVPEITILTAEALNRHKRSAEAVAMLTPLANDPHRLEAAVAAKAVLARIKPASAPKPADAD